MCECVYIYVSKVDEWVLGVCLWCVTPLIEGSPLQKAIKGVVGPECGCSPGGTLICFYVFVSDGGENCHLGDIKECVRLLIMEVSYLLRLLLVTWSRYQQQASWESLLNPFSVMS